MNGSRFPSRKRLTRRCKHCGTELLTRRTTCDRCNPGLVDWQAVPLHQLKANALQQYAAQIRSLARAAYRKSSRPTYRKSSRPKKCAVCGYATHYEVCHIKPIHHFQPSDFVAEVNRLDNLVALCPNHHWEFDHGVLSAEVIVAAASEELGAAR